MNSAKTERRHITGSRRYVEESMRKTDAPGSVAADFGPIGQTGYSRRCCPDETEGNGGIRFSAHNRAPACLFEQVEDRRRRPGADRHILQHRMQRMPQPGSMQDVAIRWTDGTVIIERRGNRRL